MVRWGESEEGEDEGGAEIAAREGDGDDGMDEEGLSTELVESWSKPGGVSVLQG